VSGIPSDPRPVDHLESYDSFDWEVTGQGEAIH